MSRSAIATQVAADIQASSWIREMFERGQRLKQQYGPDQVFDFSLGNPNAAPPPAFFKALQQVAAHPQPELHRYMPNAGLSAARDAVARLLSNLYEIPFDRDAILMATGAGGGLNVVFRALLDPGDEVIVLAPYFPEYRFYIAHAQGKMVIAETDEHFGLDVSAVASKITDRTRAILINSPNNPTGAVYTADALAELGTLLATHDRPDRPLYLICDDVYARICYDQAVPPLAANHHSRAIVVSSFSKDISIAGERLGYIALPPALPDRAQIAAACTMLNRTLGFVNAPALAQRIVAACADARCDVDFYRRNRDRLVSGLQAHGYEITTPPGALYLFPKTPIPDDAAFVDQLLEQRILAVPGRGFGRAGHMRLSFCVAPETIEGALAGFGAAIKAIE